MVNSLSSTEELELEAGDEEDEDGEEELEEEAGVEEELPVLAEELVGAAELASFKEEPWELAELIAARAPQEPSDKSEAATRINRNLFLDIKDLPLLFS